MADLDPAVELVARRLWGLKTAEGETLDGLDYAHDILDELADAGYVLLPPGGGVRTEWSEDADPVVEGDICRRGDECPRAVFHNYARTVTTFPDGSVLTSPWREVTP